MRILADVLSLHRLGCVKTRHLRQPAKEGCILHHLSVAADIAASNRVVSHDIF